MRTHVSPRDLPAGHPAPRTGHTLVRLFALGGLVLGGVAACEAVAEPEAVGRSSVTSQTGSIGGAVSNLLGQPVAGATVRTSTGAVTVTNGAGSFLIHGLSARERLPVTVEAPGYVSTTKVYSVVAGQTLTRPIRLQPEAAPVVIQAGNGGVVPFGGSGQVVIPPNAFAGVSPGSAVTVRATYLDSSDPAQVSTAPGDFTAITFSGSNVRLESFGMLQVDARNAQGQRVDLAPGQQATLRFPIRGTLSSAGFWNFDPQQGTWIEEGRVTVSGNTMNTSVTSLEARRNVDVPIQQVCVRLRVLRSDNVTPRPYEFAGVTGISYSGFTQGWTDGQGMVTLNVRASSQVRAEAGPVSQTVNTPGPGAPCPVIATLAF